MMNDEMVIRALLQVVLQTLGNQPAIAANVERSEQVLVAMGTELDAANAKITELTERLDQLSNEVNDIQQEKADHVDVSSLEAEIDNINGELSEIKEDYVSQGGLEEQVSNELEEVTRDLISQQRLEELLGDYIREDDDRVVMATNMEFLIETLDNEYVRVDNDETVLAANLQEVFTETLGDIPEEERERRHAGLATKSELDSLRSEMEAFIATIRKLLLGA